MYSFHKVKAGLKIGANNLVNSYYYSFLEGHPLADSIMLPLASICSETLKFWLYQI